MNGVLQKILIHKGVVVAKDIYNGGTFVRGHVFGDKLAMFQLGDLGVFALGEIYGEAYVLRCKINHLERLFVANHFAQYGNGAQYAVTFPRQFHRFLEQK